MLVDGERRWRAAARARLTEIPADVWPAQADIKQIQLAAFALNEQRKAPSCIHVARRLRDIKNDHGLTLEQLATQTGLPLDRVKNYLSLFGVSDFVMTFCEERELPLRVAVALVRYERATNEARVRALAQRYQKEPVTCEEINGLRKREEAKGRRKGKGERNSEVPAVAPRARKLLERFEVEFRRDQTSALAELEACAKRLGYLLVASEEA
jgi:ParB family chromosome partitioning protein